MHASARCRATSQRCISESSPAPGLGTTHSLKCERYEKMPTKKKSSALYVLLVSVFLLCMFLAIFCVAVLVVYIYLTWMVLREIASAIQSSWRRLLNSEYGWSRREKTLLPRSDYGWRFEL